MNKQPEALRWANILEHQARYDGATDYKHKAAAELRRLHQSEREGWRYADELERERKRLNEVNQMLVSVLERWYFDHGAVPMDNNLQDDTDAALSKAKDQK